MLRPGERIGDWIVEARLGEGEHGAIFLARHGLNLNLRGALKVARPPDYEKSRANFISEIEPLLMLRHEALIHVLGWGEDPKRNLLWMTTELVRGHSLEQRLADGAFGLEEIGFVFGRLAGALSLIHSHGAHHGDLRPSDVLLAEGRHIRITGFGTVFREGSQGQLDAESLAYVGPEYFDDPEGCSPVAADIYAIGLILHEAITGVRVFPVDPSLKPAPQMARIMGMKMRMGPLDPGEDVPLPLRRIVLQTTDPDPLARPSDLSGFLTALSMATRDRDDFPTTLSTVGEPEADPPPVAGPTPVRLDSSVIQQGERPTPFPFAPPGWGPRAHVVPSPLAGIVRSVPQLDVPDAGLVREVQVLERDAEAPAPPVSDAPLYDEPEFPGDTEDAWDEPEAPPVPESVAAPEPVPAPEPEFEPVPEPEESLDEAEDEAVLVEPPSAVVDEPAWDQRSGPQAPEPPVADDSSLRSGRERQRRAFVPPPPVPDPTLATPSAVPLAPVIEAPEPAAVPVAPSSPAEPVPTDVPPAPTLVEPMPLPVAPSPIPMGDTGPTLLPPEEALEPMLRSARTDPAPPVPEPANSDEFDGDAVGFFASGLPELEPEAPTPSEPEPAPPVVDDHHTHVPDDHHTHVPVEVPTEAPEPPAELDDDEDWSWHDEGGESDEGPAPSAEAAPVDPYVRPIDQLYADELDPSASDIAEDVFGDHGETAAWLKWAALVVIVVCVIIFVWMFMNRDQPGVARTDPSGPTLAAIVAAAPPPPPVEPPPEPTPEPETDPVADLEAVVAAELLEPVEAQPDATHVPEPAPRATPSSRTSSGSRSSGSSSNGSTGRTPAPAPVVSQPAATPDATQVPSVAMVEPEAPAPAAKGVMDYLRDGWSSLDSGNLVGAQGAFMAALSEDSGNGMAHYGLGQVAERARDYSGSTYHYGRAFTALGSNPTMKGELDAALRRVSAKSGAAATPAAAPAAQPAAAEGEAIEVTRKKRDELEESFRQELWDEDETQ